MSDRREQSLAERFLHAGAIEPRPHRRAVPRFVRVVASGLARLAAIVAIAAGVSVGLALLAAWWRGSDPLRAAAIGLYLGGAALIVVPLLSSSGGRTFEGGGYEYYEIETDPAARRAWQGTLAAYLVVGLSLIALGVLLETLA